MIKKLLVAAFLLVGMAHSALSQAVTYNAIATAYVTTTISQNVVFDSNMQQGGTFTMSALAHNGGGRAGQSDTANVKIEFYTSTGALVTSVNSTYNANLPNPNAVCGNPCIDTAVSWTTLTISATLTSAQAATVAYAKVSMYGIDGSYWAGDYGPWYRAPTFQLNGGGNLLYNPEFGPYNGITAQGWTSSPGFGACQGAWGGSNACIVNSDGVPGSSTAGLVANANGGGPSAAGGTTSGQAGGYNNTMSVTNAGTGATAGATPAAPTVTGTSTSTTTSTSTSYGSSSYSNVPTMSPVPGTSGNGSPQVIYNQNNTQIIATPVTVYTTSTPVTTTTYSDGTSTTSTGTPSTTSTTSTQYSSTVQTNNAPAVIIDASNNNWIYLNQAGSSNTITVNQTGRSNQLRGVNQQDAVVNGSNNTVTVDQGGAQFGPNRVDLFVQGSFNIVNTSQGTALGSTSGQYNSTSITGNNNQVISSQNNSGGTGSQYDSTTINGNNNYVNNTQANNGSKTVTTTISGDSNSVVTNQSGTGQHSVNATLTGNGNSANVTQTGSFAASASISLTNAGGPSSATVIQNATTGNAAYSVNQICVTPSGCSVSVTQNR